MARTPDLSSAPLVRIRLDLSYDGACFSGWARQPGRRTVQGTVEEALSRLLGLPEPRLTVAGRTDAGVHARGQVAHFDTPADAWARVADRVTLRLAGMLPGDVRVWAGYAAPDGFDARFSALCRRYSYRVCDDPLGVDPLRRHETVDHRHRLDVGRMNEAAAALIGEHDFAAYCRRREGASTIRRLIRFDWARESGPSAGTCGRRPTAAAAVSAGGTMAPGSCGPVPAGGSGGVPGPVPVHPSDAAPTARMGDAPGATPADVSGGVAVGPPSGVAPGPPGGAPGVLPNPRGGGTAGPPGGVPAGASGVPVSLPGGVPGGVPAGASGVAASLPSGAQGGVPHGAAGDVPPDPAGGVTAARSGGPPTGTVVATVVANAFCHNMVRALVGALLAVGDGRKPIAWPAEVLAAGLRDPAVHVAPPHGLCLEEVRYPPGTELALRAAQIRSGIAPPGP